MIKIEKKLTKKVIEDEKTKQMTEKTFVNYYLNGIQIKAAFDKERIALNKILDFEIKLEAEGN